MRQLWRISSILAMAIGWGTGSSAGAQHIHRHGFEGRDLAWMRGTADASYRETGHQLTDATAHTGQRSETIQLIAEQGHAIHYVYQVGRAPVNDDLSLSLWLKANRPGAQLLARVVLPRERDPRDLEAPLTVLIRGDIYQQVSRWQRLEIRRPGRLAREQHQLLRASLQRDVDFGEAYVDQLWLNVYSGPGFTEVWIDDLEAGPVLPGDPSRPSSRSVAEAPASGPRRSLTQGGIVQLSQDSLIADGKRLLVRGIRYSGTPLRVLREAGFNTLWVDLQTPDAALEEAARLGFWIVPALDANVAASRLASLNAVSQELARFRERDNVLFWDLGGGLAQEQAGTIGKTVQLMRAVDAQRPVGADIWDGFGPYSRQLDLLGVHRWPLLTGMELWQYRDWLSQRRQLARGAFLFTWIQTHLPDWYTQVAYRRNSSEGFSEPIGPQAEQVRLLTYIALGCGYRGLGFWSDRFLADSHQGRDRLLALALVNLELKMLEPLLVTADPVQWIATNTPEVSAAVLRTDRGLLVLPVWLGTGAQFVPGQAAKGTLTLTVPQVPIGTSAWEITAGELRSLPTERVAGGTRLTIPEFGLTSAVLFTADNGPTGILVRLQDQVRQSRKLAAQWAHDLAAVQLDKVERVQQELARLGRSVPDAANLLDDARKRLGRAEEFWNINDYRQAYAEACRAVRPLGILMRAEWRQAVDSLAAPVASPYAVSYFTLPRHWQFMEGLHRGGFGENLLSQGGFETAHDDGAWTATQAALDPLELTARVVSDEPYEGKHCLLLEARARPGTPEPAALERAFLSVTSSPISLAPGTPVRISGWVRLPAPVAASVDGVLVYDNSGGEPLALRLWRPAEKWKPFQLYRTVPDSGTLTVTVALTGLGKVYFDDLRIEPLKGTTTSLPTTEPRPSAPGLTVGRRQP